MDSLVLSYGRNNKKFDLVEVLFHSRGSAYRRDECCRLVVDCIDVNHIKGITLSNSMSLTEHQVTTTLVSDKLLKGEDHRVKW